MIFKHLVPRRITEPWEVEVMRRIFNLTLADLATRPLQPRDEHSQQRWWSALDKTRTVAHLYSPIAMPWHFVAFSLVQWKDRGIATPMFAIHPDWQHRGYGREIIDHYLEVANGPLAGSALKSNAAIMHLNKRAGWQTVSETETVAHLYHPGVPTQSDRSEARQREIYEAILDYHGIVTTTSVPATDVEVIE